MSDDLLNQFTKALADEYDGATAAPEASRARIIRTLAERKPRQKKWLVVGIPLFALLGGSTAWAAASGQLRPLVEQAGVALGILEQPAESVADSAKGGNQSGKPLSGAAKAQETMVPTAPALETTEEVAQVEHTREEQAIEEQPQETQVGRKATAGTSMEKQTSSQSDAALRKQQERTDAEAKALAAYRVGHDAQFARGDCQAAVAAYQSYLETYPNGNFTLEARYNRSVCLVQLGRSIEARQQLEPFAAGTYGNYRRSSAQALIDAIDAHN